MSGDGCMLDQEELRGLVDSIDEGQWQLHRFTLPCWPISTEDVRVPRQLTMLPQAPDQRSTGAKCFETAWPGAAALIQEGGGPS